MVKYITRTGKELETYDVEQGDVVNTPEEVVHETIEQPKTFKDKVHNAYSSAGNYIKETYNKKFNPSEEQIEQEEAKFELQQRRAAMGMKKKEMQIAQQSLNNEQREMRRSNIPSFGGGNPLGQSGSQPSGMRQQPYNPLGGPTSRGVGPMQTMNPFGGSFGPKKGKKHNPFGRIGPI